MYVILDTHLRIPYEEMDPAIAVQLIEAVTFKNPEKAAAKKQLLYGWEDLPDNITFMEQENGCLVLPRGFAHQFYTSMKKAGLEVELQDDRACPPGDLGFWEEGMLKPAREHQVPAIKALIEGEQGIYSGPPGSGKSVVGLATAWSVPTPAIILIHKKEIADQWRRYGDEYFGYEMGFIGDGKWEERQITVAMVQTLWSQRERLDVEHWWGKWGCLILDECHHQAAETYQELVQRFPARFRIGLSATPKKGQKGVPYAEMILGRVLHKTTKEELRGKGILMEPKVQVIKTNFEFEFKRARRINGRRIGSNYSKMVDALIRDQPRNAKIATVAASQRGHHQLVLSKRLEHLDTLVELVVANGVPPESIMMLRGKESLEERAEVASRVYDMDESIIFSTLADEALDIPPIDRVHLTYPQRDKELVEQQMGRGGRAYPGKIDTIIFDYADWEQPVLRSQFVDRRKLYNREKIEVLGL